MPNHANFLLVEKQLVDAYSDMRRASYELFVANQALIVAKRAVKATEQLCSQNEEYKILKNDDQRGLYLRSRYGKEYDQVDQASDIVDQCKYNKEICQLDIDEARALLRLYLAESGASVISDQDA